jgi:hypothetical protein
MGLLADFEKEAKDIFDTIDADAKALASIIFGGVKAAGAEIVAAIPSLTSKLSAYAKVVVEELEKDLQLRDAAGHWKAGVAAARVWALLKHEFPAIEKVGAAALPPAIETAVQAAFAAMRVLS